MTATSSLLRIWVECALSNSMAEPSASLASLFAPRSVAVVGASSDEQKIGNIVLRNIVESGFRGALYPVNPKSSVIRGMTCFQRIADLPEAPDMAVIAIPAEFVFESVEQLAKRGTKQIVILTAGFKEIGDEGAGREQALKVLAQKHGLSILGPNCLGFLNMAHPINATFGQVLRQQGPLRFISQSGAIATSLFDWADHAGIGFAEFVTLGNKTVLSEVDVLEYWLKTQAAAQPVGMYLESLEQGERFLRVARQHALQAPVFVLKPGKSAAARSAMQSHTGALAGDDAVLDAALERAGVLRCESLEDLFDLAKASSWSAAPRGTSVAVISNAGGPAVIASDSLAEYGMALATISGETKRTLQKHLPRAASLKNPIDVLGDALADRYEVAIRAVLKNPEIDSLLVILTPQVMTQIEQTAQVIGKLSKEFKKPIFCSFMGGSHVARGEQVLNSFHIPSFQYPERAIRALSFLWRWQQWREAQLRATRSPQPARAGQGLMAKRDFSLQELATALIAQATPLIQAARERDQQALDSYTLDALLQTAGIPVPPSQRVTNPQQACLFAQSVGYPVVTKLIGPSLLHKTELNAVRTNIRDDLHLRQTIDQLVEVRRTLRDAHDVSIQVQKQVKTGVEILLGSKRDPQFGPLLLFGAGGQLAELIGGHVMTLLPASDAQLRAMIEKSKLYPLLRGFRGGHQYSIAALIEIMQRFSQLVLALSDVAELEINPLILHPTGMFAVDAKAVLTQEPHG